MNYSNKTLLLKYTINHTAFQPNSTNTGTIIFNSIPAGSYVNGAYIGVNTNFGGGSITKAEIESDFTLLNTRLTDKKDCLLHPYIPPIPYIPVSNNILISTNNKEKIKIHLKVDNGTIDDLTQGQFDIYISVNEIQYPNKLDVIYKIPNTVIGMEKYLSGYVGYWGRIYRKSDGNSQWFGFVDNFVDNDSIISWLAGETGYLRNILDQTGNVNHYSQPNVNFMPVYDPGNSKIIFDGINDFMINTNATPKTEQTLISVNTIDSNYLLAHTNNVSSWYGTHANTTSYRDAGKRYAFNSTKSGKTLGIITMNTTECHCRTDGIEVNNSPVNWSSGGSLFNMLGSRRYNTYYTGDFYSLFIYDTVLADTEINLIEKLFKV